MPGNLKKVLQYTYINIIYLFFINLEVNHSLKNTDLQRPWEKTGVLPQAKRNVKS